MKIIEELKKRREEARREGRLVHPEPLFSEFRRRRTRILVKEDSLLFILVKRTGDLTEETLRYFRNLDYWASVTANTITSIFVGALFGPQLKRAEERLSRLIKR